MGEQNFSGETSEHLKRQPNEDASKTEKYKTRDQLPVNYDEDQVPRYELPEILRLEDGTEVTDVNQWQTKRRPELLNLFASQVYGRAPELPNTCRPVFYEEGTKALDGLAIRRQLHIPFTHRPDGPGMNMLLYLPIDAVRPVPLFLGLNFCGNHSIAYDPDIRLPTTWMREGEGVIDHRATEAGRGVMSSRWPVATILNRGYGLATIYYGDIDPDFDDGFQNGVHPHFYSEGQQRPRSDEWGAIAAWAWGLRRAMDYLEIDSDVDSKRVAVMGHSRLGKAALWAGAQDERFAMVISNESGCGGAALSRRRFGETVAHINRQFPHWFCENFKAYNHREDDLPVDQHQLLALMAPRPLYVASAQEDLWADPKGEFLALWKASSAYRLFGLESLPLYAISPVDEITDVVETRSPHESSLGGLSSHGLSSDRKPPAPQMPPLHEPFVGTCGYHIREGKHGVKLYDWQRFLDFADHHFSPPM